ncbi:unnamed protein product [Echinostoma caproni]|uniref:PD-(D/E)XK nuclease family transposase n=1 Tax=Echinostoma caproni TaxID=27848 RepID=A0A183B5H5_9TREM|nr:unnamed protein product [Echinostoma caproni]
MSKSIDPTRDQALDLTGTTTGSCPLTYPPLNLGTGSLNQLADTILLHLLVPESTIEIADPIKLTDGVVASDIKIYQLDTIHRTCAIELQTSDSLGCSERGLLLKACLGARQIRANLSLTTPYAGLKEGVSSSDIPRIVSSAD